MKAWVDAASAALGMDICALDGVHSKIDGKEYILELNDSAIGFNSRHTQEDLDHVLDLVLLRMTQAYPETSLDHKPKEEGEGKGTADQEERIRGLNEEAMRLRVQLEKITREKNDLKKSLHAEREKRNQMTETAPIPAGKKNKRWLKGGEK